MTPLLEALSDIEDRLAKATRGPWECKDGPDAPFDGGYRVLGPYNVKPPLHFDNRDWNGEFVDYENAVFAAHARQDVPRLLDIIAVLDEVLGDLLPTLPARTQIERVTEAQAKALEIAKGEV